jgi:hypothetical protein
VLLTIATPARADPDSTRLAAQTVLTKTRVRCYASGQPEGGFDFVLDAKQLVEKK